MPNFNQLLADTFKLPVCAMYFYFKQTILLKLHLLKTQGDLTMGLIDLIIIILLIAWLGGFSLHVGGGIIHILIVIAIVLLVIRLLGIGRNRL